MGRAMKFLVALNCFTTLMGISMLIASAYARAQMREEGWGSLMNTQSASALGIVTGLFTLGLSVIGCVGAAARQKRMLCCYMCGLALVLCLQIGAAVLMTNYSNALQVRDEKALETASSLLTFPPDIAINNAAFSVYAKCCSGCPSTVCNNTAPGAYYNGTLQNCMGNVTCHIVTPCDVANEPKCFIYGKDQQNVVVPPMVIPDSLCDGLSRIWLGGDNGHYIVGPADTGSCGRGNPVDFLQDMDTFVGDSLYGVAAFFTFVAVIEGLAFLAGIYLIFCAKQVTVQGEDDEQPTTMRGEEL